MQLPFDAGQVDLCGRGRCDRGRRRWSQRRCRHVLHECGRRRHRRGAVAQRVASRADLGDGRIKAVRAQRRRNVIASALAHFRGGALDRVIRVRALRRLLNLRRGLRQVRQPHVEAGNRVVELIGKTGCGWSARGSDAPLRHLIDLTGDAVEPLMNLGKTVGGLRRHWRRRRRIGRRRCGRCIGRWCCRRRIGWITGAGWTIFVFSHSPSDIPAGRVALAAASAFPLVGTRDFMLDPVSEAIAPCIATSSPTRALEQTSKFVRRRSAFTPDFSLVR